MKKSLLLFLASNLMLAQVGINTGGTIDSGAVLEVKSSSKGVLLPRLSDHTAITSPTPGMLIYDIADQCINYYAETTGWINPCDNSGDGGDGTGSGMCASEDGIYPSTAITAIERGNTHTVGVTANGDLVTAGMFTANGDPNLFNGGERISYRDVTIIDGPWGDTPIVGTDITRNSNRSIAWVTASTDAVYFTNAQSTDSFKEITLIGAPAGTKIADAKLTLGEVIILTEDGDVYETPLNNGTIRSYEANKVNLPEKVTKINVGDAGATAFGGASGDMYVWGDSCSIYIALNIDGSGTKACNQVTTHTKDDPATFSLSSDIINVDLSEPGSVLGIVTANGDLYHVGSTNNTSSTLANFAYNSDPDVIVDRNGDALLAAGEKIINVGIGATGPSAAIVTDRGRIFSYSSGTQGSFWYLEHELGAKDPSSVVFSGDDKTAPMAAVIDGDYYEWTITQNGTSNIPLSNPTGLGGDWQSNSPLKVNVCLNNK
ncbi:hypothetical protein UJ101_02529 [Flavobacteriaceae bacterium UJ101]|nr:hypothetical protein UJ101_02529 [Flavobacteriaceae bacterium UJ101]